MRFITSVPVRFGCAQCFLYMYIHNIVEDLNILVLLTAAYINIIVYAAIHRSMCLHGRFLSHFLRL